MPCTALHEYVNCTSANTIEQKRRPSETCTQHTSDDDDRFQVYLGADNDIPGRLSQMRSLHSMHLAANQLLSEGRPKSANLLPHHRSIETIDGCHAQVQSSCSVCADIHKRPRLFCSIHSNAPCCRYGKCISRYLVRDTSRHPSLREAPMVLSN